jgi:hypothetical protein
MGAAMILLPDNNSIPGVNGALLLISGVYEATF